MLQWVKGCRPDLEGVEPRFGGCSRSRGVAKVSSLEVTGIGLKV